MMNVALIYIRKSVVRYEQDRARPERQLENCARVCEEKGWGHEVYEDAEGHRSGRSEKHVYDSYYGLGQSTYSLGV